MQGNTHYCTQSAISSEERNLPSWRNGLGVKRVTRNDKILGSNPSCAYFLQQVGD